MLPFLLGEALVARVDLKSDRQAGVLRVQSRMARARRRTPTRRGRGELAAELAVTAAWLGLDRRRGDADARGDLAAARWSRRRAAG